MEFNIYHEIIIEVKLSPKKILLKYSLTLVRHEVPVRYDIKYFTPKCSLNPSKEVQEYRLIGKSVGEYYGHLKFKSSDVWKSGWIECKKANLVDTLIVFLTKKKCFELFDPILIALRKQFRVNLVEIPDPIWFKQLLRFNANKKEIIKLEKNIDLIAHDSKEYKERVVDSKKFFKTQKESLKTTESKSDSWWRQKKVDKINDLLPELNSNVLYYKKVAVVKSNRFEIEKDKLRILNTKQKDLIKSIEKTNSKIFLDDKKQKVKNITDDESNTNTTTIAKTSKLRKTKQLDVEAKAKTIKLIPTKPLNVEAKAKAVKLHPTKQLDVEAKAKTVKLHPTKQLDVEAKAKTVKLIPTKPLNVEAKAKTVKLHPTKQLDVEAKAKTVKLHPTKQLDVEAKAKTVKLIPTKPLNVEAKAKTAKLHPTKQLDVEAKAKTIKLIPTKRFGLKRKTAKIQTDEKLDKSDEKKTKKLKSASIVA